MAAVGPATHLIMGKQDGGKEVEGQVIFILGRHHRNSTCHFCLLFVDKNTYMWLNIAAMEAGNSHLLSWISRDLIKNKVPKGKFL